MSEYDGGGEHRQQLRRKEDIEIRGEVRFFKHLATFGAAFLLIVAVFQSGMIVALWKIRESMLDIPTLRANVSTLSQSVASLAEEVKQLREQREQDIQNRLRNRTVP